MSCAELNAASGSPIRRRKVFCILELTTQLRFLWYLITKDITLMTSVVDVASLSYKQIMIDFFFFFFNVCATEPACEMNGICRCQGDVCDYMANLVGLLQQ